MIGYTQLIEDLRRYLRDGATPSRLIQHILAVRGSGISYDELCALFQDAFHLPVARISPSSLPPQLDHRGVVLNKTLLMEIVARQGNWDAVRAVGQPAERSWLDGLTLQTTEDIANEVRSAPVPGLHPANWSALTPAEQETLHGHLTSARVLHQRIEVLSRLVERLQEKICDLEQTRLPQSNGEHRSR